MSNSGFVRGLLDNSNLIHSLGLQQFSWYKKLLGTIVRVDRVRENTKYKNVFGSIVSSTLPGDEDVEKLTGTVLINMNDMKRIYLMSTDSLQFYDNEDFFKLGDILVFSRGVKEFKWKVTEIMTFSEAGGVLNQYTIQGLAETNSK